jgi:hypothetical protein
MLRVLLKLMDGTWVATWSDLGAISKELNAWGALA